MTEPTPKEDQALIELLRRQTNKPTPTLQKTLAWADLDDEAYQEAGDDFNTDKREAMEYAWDQGYIAGLKAGVKLALNSHRAAAELVDAPTSVRVHGEDHPNL